MEGPVESDVSENDETEDDFTGRVQEPVVDYDDELSFVDEPRVEKKLKPSLVVTPTSTIQGKKTATLDASGTTVTNMAPIDYQANVRFLWTCPALF